MKLKGVDPVEEQDKVQGEGDKQSQESQVVEVAREIILEIKKKMFRN